MAPTPRSSGEALLVAFGVQEGACHFMRGFERAPFCKTRGNKKGLARAAMPRAFDSASPPKCNLSHVQRGCEVVPTREEEDVR